MSGSGYAASRPISLAIPRDTKKAAHGRPTLDDVLNNRAPPPYTLTAYMAFLSQQHCLETLEFTLESKKYRETYEKAVEQMGGQPVTSDSDEGFDLQQDWMRILDVYIKPGAPREINLPSEERDDLLDYPYDPELPHPDALDPSVKRMYDLMSDSIFIPFCNSFAPVTHAQTYAAPYADFGRGGDDKMDVSRSSFDDRGNTQIRKAPRRHRSPHLSSAHGIDFSAPRSPPGAHRHTQSSTLSSAIGRSTSNRLSTHVSNSSAASESALTDDSGSGDGGGPGDPMTPPTTPPSSDIGLHGTSGLHALKQNRSDSGSWRKVGMKIWGKKKNGSTLQERPEES